MSDGHEHHHHDREHARLPETQVQDAGTQALAEALRSSFTIVKIVMVLMVIAFFCSGFFTVGTSEKAIILRFGKPVGEGEKALIPSGQLHWAWPYPIDEVVKIPITAQQTVESTVGWYFTTPAMEAAGTEPPPGSSLDPARDGFAITADRNIIHTSATLTYHIEDPIRYVFGFVSASNIVVNALNNSILYTAAHFKVDDALYNNYDGFREAVQDHVMDLVEQEKLGIVVDSCAVRNIPPRQLADVFAQVIESGQNLNKTINEAKTAANKTLMDAGAQAAAIVNQAESARTNYVLLVNADAERFSKLLPTYRTNAALVEQQMFLPMLANALTNVQDIWFLPAQSDGKTLLQLNREPPQPKTATSP